MLDRQRALDVESAYRFDKITKKLYPVRQVMRERKYIDYAATNRKLPGFVHKINPLKLVFYQELVDKIDSEFIPYCYFERIFSQRIGVNHHFGQCLRISDDQPAEFG